MDPAPEHVSFDTVLELTAASMRYRVRDDLLLYYERELTYMRPMAAQFAEKYPKIASRLVLEPTKCDDPHVERLLEAFSFLAARVHLKIDDEFPEITEALLGIIYPHFIRPLPSMSIVQFHLDPEKGKLTSGLPDRPRYTALFPTRGRRPVQVPHLLRHHPLADFGYRRQLDHPRPTEASAQGRGCRWGAAHRADLQHRRPGICQARSGPASIFPGR